MRVAGVDGLAKFPRDLDAVLVLCLHSTQFVIGGNAVRIPFGNLLAPAAGGGKKDTTRSCPLRLRRKTSPRSKLRSVARATLRIEESVQPPRRQPGLCCATLRGKDLGDDGLLSGSGFPKAQDFLLDDALPGGDFRLLERLPERKDGGPVLLTVGYGLQLRVPSRVGLRDKVFRDSLFGEHRRRVHAPFEADLRVTLRLAAGLLPRPFATISRNRSISVGVVLHRLRYSRSSRGRFEESMSPTEM